MEKNAKDLKIGEKFQPWLVEKTIGTKRERRVNKTYTVTGEPQHVDFGGADYVTISCLTAMGKVDEVFILSEETVLIIE